MSRYRFGGYTVDADTIEVVGPDGVREVEPQVFDVLRYLVEHHGRLVTKEELLDNVWGDRFVSESALTTRIKQARRAVDDDGTTQWAIKTVHGRGYRFVAELDVAGDAAVAEPVASPDAVLTLESGAFTSEWTCAAPTRFPTTRRCSGMSRPNSRRSFAAHRFSSSLSFCLALPVVRVASFRTGRCSLPNPQNARETYTPG